jgi:hypothetical protein
VKQSAPPGLFSGLKSESNGNKKRFDDDSDDEKPKNTHKKIKEE